MAQQGVKVQSKGAGYWEAQAVAIRKVQAATAAVAQGVAKAA